MDQTQLDQIVEEVREEFYTDRDFVDSYYGDFIKKSPQDRFDDYFLFSSVNRNSMLDAYVAISQWEKAQTRLDDLQMEEAARLALDAVEPATSVTTKYLRYGLRRGLSDMHVTQKKEADPAWQSLISQDPRPEEKLLLSSYPLMELQERVASASMLQTVGYLGQHNKETKQSNAWPLLCGGFCFGVMSASLQAWTFGGRIAEMVLISEEMSGLDQGEPDGQETEEKGSGGD